MLSATQIRDTIRSLRRSIPAVERRNAALQLVDRVVSLGIFTTAQRIGGYLAFDGEMDAVPLLQIAQSRGKQVYLPILGSTPNQPMQFAPFTTETELKPNRFGIPEPQVPCEALFPPQHLDLVLTPLVAFDPSGTRLGMGGGFYDRTFAFLNDHGNHVGPFLLGLAYELQKVERLTRQPWDVPLAGIATERAFYPSKAAMTCTEIKSA